jgi:hypothetical protein
VAMAVLWSGLLLTGTISIVFASRGALKEPLTVSLRAE